MMKNIGTAVLATVLTLFVVEMMLRLTGWVPGQFQYNKWIEQVDQLRSVHGFTADKDGVFKVDTAVSNEIERRIRNSDNPLENVGRFCNENHIVHEVGAVCDDHYFPKKREGEFFSRVERILSSVDRSSFDSLILNYHQHPINKDGFYSIPLSTRLKGKGRVLLLGDSFTWGHSTSNKTLSFSNHLLNKGFVVFNTGISGSDVPQYLQVLKKYSEQLNPDVVVLNLFMGNDVVPFERTPLPNIPVHYSTNAGNVLSFQADVQYHSPEEAYQRVMNNMIVPNTTSLNRAASKTVITTLIWAGLARFGLVDCTFTQYPDEPEVKETRSLLLEAIRYCNQRNIPFVLSVIPRVEGDKMVGHDLEPEVFRDIRFVQATLTSDQYKISDGHFNDEGHKAYADFLEEIITKELSNSDHSE